MRLLIDTSSIQFQVAGPTKARPDFRDKEQQAETRDGLTFDGFTQVRGLVFAPLVGRDSKIRRSFRADAVEPVLSGKSVQAA